MGSCCIHLSVLGTFHSEKYASDSKITTRISDKVILLTTLKTTIDFGWYVKLHA